MPPAPRIAVGPTADAQAVEAVVAGGGTPVDVGDAADGLVWLAPRDPSGLADALAATPGVRWIQLPFAAVNPFFDAGMIDHDRTWTCAKGCYAEPVAEHALALALAGLRHLPERVRATSWGEAKGTSLYDRDVTIVGGGGITTSLLELLRPFRVRATVVRPHVQEMAGAARVVGPEDLLDTLPGAQVVFLAAALTAATRGMIDTRALAKMDDDAWLVNVARGPLVVTDDLIAALTHPSIAGAALDVTEPEPLPDGHPLWTAPNVIITPHTADWPELVQRLLALRITTNTGLFARGEPLEGVVDPDAGY